MEHNEQKRKKILIVMAPEWASFYATLKLARELKQGGSGYRVDYFGPPGLEEIVVAQDLGYRAFDIDGIYKDRIFHNLENEIGEKIKKSGGRPGKIGMYRARMRAHLKTHQEILRSIEELLIRDLPDLVLLGPLMVDYIVPFLKLKVPIITLNFTLISIWSLTVPPVYSGVVPHSRLGLISYGRNVLAWSKMFLKNFLFNTRTYCKFRFGFGFSPFYNLKKEAGKYGARLKRTDTKLRLHAPELVTCPKEFDFPFAARTNSRIYIGASLYTRRQEAPFDWKSINREKPIIYCTLGTTSMIYEHRKNLYQAVIEVIRQRPDLQLILQVGDEGEIEGFRPLPKNIFVYRWVPHMQVLPHTAIMICHGGLGTVREAVYFGVPLIVFPAERDDPGNSARVVFHHLGLRGNIKRVNARKIHSLIDRLSNDGFIHRSVKRMQQVFREQEDCRRGVEFIEEFLAS
jgi:UDP:flavonoid glycosyltransferase YjiC (YdhE family)